MNTLWPILEAPSIEQSETHIIIFCENDIDCMLWAHSWDAPFSKLYSWEIKIPSPLLDNAVHQVYKDYGPDECTAAACSL